MTKTSKKILSLITLLCFVFSQSVDAYPGMGIEMRASRETPSFFQIQIPSDLATVDGIFEAPARPDPRMILHVQNAHANYDAQQKIKQLLEYLEKTYAIKTIFVEGASEDLNPDYLKFFPDAERNRKLADYLARQGELTGAEMFLLESGAGVRSAERDNGAGARDTSPVRAHGIERAELYRENYEALKKVFGSEAVVSKYLEGFEVRLDKLASNVFLPDLRKILREWKKFENGHREFIPYVKDLVADANRFLGEDLESLFAQVEWPQISRLLVLQMMEKNLDAEKGISEKERVVRFLKEKRVSQNLITGIETFQDQRVTMPLGESAGGTVQPRDLMEQLVMEAGPKGFLFHDYPYFSLYAGYLILKSELDPKGLFDEIGLLFRKILDELAKTDQQKALLDLYRDEELVRKLLNLELTRKNWEEVLARKARLEPEVLVDRLKELGATKEQKRSAWGEDHGTAGEKRAPEPVSRSKKFREIIDIQNAAYAFYDAARRREEVFYEKIDETMRERRISKAVLVTGGFHTDGITELLREHEISYGILTPRLSEKSDEHLYRSLMLQNQPSTFELSYLEATSRLISFVGQTKQMNREQVLRNLKPVLKAIGYSGSFKNVRQVIEAFNRSSFSADAGIQIDPEPVRKKGDKPVYRVVLSGTFATKDQILGVIQRLATELPKPTDNPAALASIAKLAPALAQVGTRTGDVVKTGEVRRPDDKDAEKTVQRIVVAHAKAAGVPTAEYAAALVREFDSHSEMGNENHTFDVTRPAPRVEARAETRVAEFTYRELLKGFMTMLRSHQRPVHVRGIWPGGGVDPNPNIRNYIQTLRLNRRQKVIPDVIRVYLPITTVEGQLVTGSGRYEDSMVPKSEELLPADVWHALRQASEDGLFELVELGDRAAYDNAARELGVPEQSFFETMVSNNRVLFVSEWVEGTTLDAVLGNTQNPDMHREVGRNLGRVLRELHQNGILVDDNNIDQYIVTPEGQVLRLDLEKIYGEGAPQEGFESQYSFFADALRQDYPVFSESFVEGYGENLRANRSEQRSRIDQVRGKLNGMIGIGGWDSIINAVSKEEVERHLKSLNNGQMPYIGKHIDPRLLDIHEKIEILATREGLSFDEAHKLAREFEQLFRDWLLGPRRGATAALIWPSGEETVIYRMRDMPGDHDILELVVNRKGKLYIRRSAWRRDKTTGEWGWQYADFMDHLIQLVGSRIKEDPRFENYQRIYENLMVTVALEKKWGSAVEELEFISSYPYSKLIEIGKKYGIDWTEEEWFPFAADVLFAEADVGQFMPPVKLAIDRAQGEAMRKKGSVPSPAQRPAPILKAMTFDGRTVEVPSSRSEARAEQSVPAVAGTIQVGVEEFVEALTSMLEPFKNGRRLRADELSRFSEWGIPGPEFFPMDAAGRPRPFTPEEFGRIVWGVLKEMNVADRSAKLLRPNLDDFLSGKDARALKAVNYFLESLPATREYIAEHYPHHRVVALARDGNLLHLANDFAHPEAVREVARSIYFSLPTLGGPHANALEGIAAHTGTIHDIQSAADRIYREVEADFKAGKMESFAAAFIEKFRQWLRENADAAEFLKSFLGPQVNRLKLDESEPILIYDTIGTGKSSLVVASYIREIHPQAPVDVLLGFMVDAFKLSVRDDYPVKAYEFGDWPFQIKSFDASSGNIYFTYTGKLSDWVINMLLAYNRAVIGRDEELVKRAPMDDYSFLFSKPTLDAIPVQSAGAATTRPEARAETRASAGQTEGSKQPAPETLGFGTHSPEQVAGIVRLLEMSNPFRGLNLNNLGVPGEKLTEENWKNVAKGVLNARRSMASARYAQWFLYQEAQFLAGDFANRMREILDQARETGREPDRKIMVMAFGVGNKPMEGVAGYETYAILRAFSDAFSNSRLSELGEDISKWKLTYLGFDINEKSLRDIQESFSDQEGLKKRLGLAVNPSDIFEFHFEKADLFYPETIQETLNRLSLAGQKADYVFERNMSYANSAAALLTPDWENLDDVAVAVATQMVYRNILLTVGREGTRYILESTQHGNSDWPIYVPPGMLHMGTDRSLGFLKLDNFEQMRDASVQDWQNSIRNTVRLEISATTDFTNLARGTSGTERSPSVQPFPVGEAGVATTRPEARAEIRAEQLELFEDVTLGARTLTIGVAQLAKYLEAGILARQGDGRVDLGHRADSKMRGAVGAVNSGFAVRRQEFSVGGKTFSAGELLIQILDGNIEFVDDRDPGDIYDRAPGGHFAFRGEKRSEVRGNQLAVVQGETLIMPPDDRNLVRWGPWVVSGHYLPAHSGWKLHIQMEEENARKIARTIQDILEHFQIPFKVVATIDDLRRMNTQPPPQKGKGMVVYWRGDDALRVDQMLNRALSEKVEDVNRRFRALKKEMIMGLLLPSVNGFLFLKRITGFDLKKAFSILTYRSMDIEDLGLMFLATLIDRELYARGIRPPATQAFDSEGRTGDKLFEGFTGRIGYRWADSRPLVDDGRRYKPEDVHRTLALGSDPADRYRRPAVWEREGIELFLAELADKERRRIFSRSELREKEVSSKTYQLDIDDTKEGVGAFVHEFGNFLTSSGILANMELWGYQLNPESKLAKFCSTLQDIMENYNEDPLGNLSEVVNDLYKIFHEASWKGLENELGALKEPVEADFTIEYLKHTLQLQEYFYWFLASHLVGVEEIPGKTLWLKETLESVVSISDALRGKVEISEEPQGTGQKIELTTDGAALAQVLLNLLRNAQRAVEVKFGKNSPEKGKIRVRIRRVGGSHPRILVTVWDNGVGMSSDVQKKIFSESVTTKETQEGHGFGLMVVAERVKNRLGGRIRFRSKEGEGTVFMLQLPVDINHPLKNISEDTYQKDQSQRSETREREMPSTAKVSPTSSPDGVVSYIAANFPDYKSLDLPSEIFGGSGTDLIAVLIDVAVQLGLSPIVAVKGALNYARFEGNIDWRNVSDFDLTLYIPALTHHSDSQVLHRQISEGLSRELEKRGHKMSREETEGLVEVSIYNFRDHYDHVISLDIQPMSALAGNDLLLNYNPFDQYFGRPDAVDGFKQLIDYSFSRTSVLNLAEAQYRDIYKRAKAMRSSSDVRDVQKTFKRLAQLAYWIGDSLRHGKYLEKYQNAFDQLFEDKLNRQRLEDDLDKELPLMDPDLIGRDLLRKSLAVFLNIAPEAEVQRAEVRAVLGPILKVGEGERIGYAPEFIEGLEKSGFNNDPFYARVLSAALAGKIIRQGGITAEDSASILKALMTAGSKKTGDWVGEVKKILELEDKLGLFAELHRIKKGASLTGVITEGLLQECRVLLTANGQQRISLLIAADTSDKEALNVAAQEMVKREMEWADGEGLDFSGRFEIIIVNAGMLGPELQSFSNRQRGALQKVLKGRQSELKDVADFFVISIGEDMFPSFQGSLDTISGTTIVRPDEVERNPELFGASRFAGVQASTDKVAGGAELLDGRTDLFTPVDRHLRHYRFVVDGLRGLASQLFQAVESLRRIAVAA